MSGKIVRESYIDIGVSLLTLHLSLNAGFYIVEVLYGNISLAVQKLIVVL
jgi:hypothetical protein